MGKIDWYCSHCDFGFRAYDGRCPECKQPIRAINKFEWVTPADKDEWLRMVLWKLRF